MSNFYCPDRTISLVSDSIPDDLYHLFTYNLGESETFRTYIRKYNNIFAFTSFGVKAGKNLCKMNKSKFKDRFII